MFKGLIITKEELESGNLEDLLIKKPVKENDVTNSYPTLVKFLVASVHCEKCKENATLSLTTKNLVEETKKKLVGPKAEAICTGGSNKKLVGPDAEAICTGGSDDPVPFSSWPTFKETRGKPVGSLDNILFWNKEQIKFLFQDCSKCILCGEFGTGKENK